MVLRDRLALFEQRVPDSPVLRMVPRNQQAQLYKARKNRLPVSQRRVPLYPRLPVLQMRAAQVVHLSELAYYCHSLLISKTIIIDTIIINYCTFIGTAYVGVTF